MSTIRPWESELSEEWIETSKSVDSSALNSSNPHETSIRILQNTQPSAPWKNHSFKDFFSPLGIESLFTPKNDEELTLNLRYTQDASNRSVSFEQKMERNEEKVKCTRLLESSTLTQKYIDQLIEDIDRGKESKKPMMIKGEKSSALMNELGNNANMVFNEKENRWEGNEEDAFGTPDNKAKDEQLSIVEALDVSVPHDIDSVLEADTSPSSISSSKSSPLKKNRSFSEALQSLERVASIGSSDNYPSKIRKFRTPSPKSKEAQIYKNTPLAKYFSQFDDDWLNVKSLDLSFLGFDSLNGLDSIVPKLRHLTADNNNLKYLQGVPSNVLRLSVQSNKLHPFTTFSHLINIEYLNISDNSVEDLNLISDLVHLKEIVADNNRISSLSFIGKTSLVSLSLENNNLATFDCTSNATLEYLNVSGNKLSLLCHLEQLTALKVLKAENAGIKEMQCAEPLRNLKELNLKDNNLRCVPFNKMPGLQLVDVDNNLLPRFDQKTRAVQLFARHQRASM